MKHDKRFQEYGIYRHFKGNFYLLEDVVFDSETLERMVLYRQLYGERKLFVRPYEMFFSRVDRQKYPNIQQKYRFELLDIESKNK